MLERLKEDIAGLPGVVWTVILGGVLVRLMVDRSAPFWSGVTASLAGLFCSVVFTKPLIVIAELPKDHGSMMFVAGIWALLGYNFIKLLIGLTDIEGLIRLIRAWREK